MAYLALPTHLKPIGLGYRKKSNALIMGSVLGVFVLLRNDTKSCFCYLFIQILLQKNNCLTEKIKLTKAIGCVKLAFWN